MTIILNNNKINNYKFSGGECHVKDAFIYTKNKNTIIAFLKNSDDIMMLILCVDAMRRYSPDCYITLKIPYLPYSRQDRVCNFGEPYSLGVISKIINELKCDEVIINNPHSFISNKIINNLINDFSFELKVLDLKNNNLFYNNGINKNDIIFIFPDNGAIERFNQDFLATDYIVFEKKRSIDNKNLSIYCKNIEKMHSKYCLVIDDICDGGRTFIELAKYANEKNIMPKNLNLYINTGIFSNGLDELNKYYNKIWCDHTFLNNNEIEKNKEFLIVANKY